MEHTDLRNTWILLFLILDRFFLPFVFLSFSPSNIL